MTDSVQRRIDLIEESIPASAPWISDHYPEGSVVRPASGTTSILKLHANTRTPLLSKADADFIATSTVDVRWLIAKLRLVLVRNEALMDLLRRYSPDSMGGTPDLFAPDCGHEVADEMNHNPWDCLDEQVRVLALDLDSEVAS